MSKKLLAAKLNSCKLSELEHCLSFNGKWSHGILNTYSVLPRSVALINFLICRVWIFKYIAAQQRSLILPHTHRRDPNMRWILSMLWEWLYIFLSSIPVTIDAYKAWAKTLPTLLGWTSYLCANNYCQFSWLRVQQHQHMCGDPRWWLPSILHALAIGAHEIKCNTVIDPNSCIIQIIHYIRMHTRCILLCRCGERISFLDLSSKGCANSFVFSCAFPSDVSRVREACRSKFRLPVSPPNLDRGNWS